MIPKLKFKTIRQLLLNQLDVFETDRLLKKMQIRADDEEFTYDQIHSSMEELLDVDLNDCIVAGFRKLDF